MLRALVDANYPNAIELWAALEQCSGQDRFLYDNLTGDLRLNEDAEFQRTAAAVEAEIVRLFRVWHEEYLNQPTGEKPFVDAYDRALAVGGGFRNLFLLGFTITDLPDEHCQGWVSFVKYRPPSGDDISVHMTLETVTNSIQGTCRYKRMVWIACRNSLKDHIENSQSLDGSHRPFDEIADRLGLGRYWDTPGIPIVALKLSLSRGEPLARVPTFFDACGYPYFRPATKDWLERHRCGCTCPIDDPKGDGVAELVVWVGDERPPPHVSSAGSHLNGWSVLSDENGDPLVFIVKSRTHLTDYDRRRA